ncbi:PQQ-dependent sugar dehydrogenase [Croceibacterium sp. TMG7-5b_MA50]|uniref:PQQ-dependent sugar dehydrogenase n=1 Tax=Croceibacterium sp. TMG7-5b_MA50 TaxID=3121290 RepID=UPI003221F26F
MRNIVLASSLLPIALASASCGSAQDGGATADVRTSAGLASGQPVSLDGDPPFTAASLGQFAEPWALALAPGTDTLFVTERAGTMKFVNLVDGQVGTVTGLPDVAYAGQGGLGDVAFLPGESSATLGGRTIYLTWAEPGSGDTRGAALGRGTLTCADASSCAVENLQVIWRQDPKVTGAGHYSHRIAFAPDGQHLFLASGDRQKKTPAQDLGTNLGKVLRLNLDGTPAAGNPFADRGGVSREIWSYGHRNILGLHFDAQGRLWDLEHGPKGGDELNLVVEGDNYGWPIVSDGDDYNGTPIPDHATRPEFHAAAIGWNPVIAPGDFLFYSGAMFPQWQDQALMPGLASKALVRVSINGERGTEEARYPFPERLRDIAQAPDGSLLLIEDGEGGRLLRLTPR